MTLAWVSDPAYPLTGSPNVTKKPLGGEQA